MTSVVVGAWTLAEGLDRLAAHYQGLPARI